ncbi:MAG: hypothetical protein L0Y74_09230 [candidate division Zixibacteria bacterium]|nr:hypothetical protein [candidate division Zixibacteria bacterium]
MLGLGFCFFGAILVSAQTPDPRDSVIIESKTVNPGAGKPAVRVKVSITNKDTLANVTLALVERSLTGGAYMTLAWPRTFDSVITLLNTSMTAYKFFKPWDGNGISPDTFVVALLSDPLDTSTREYPNLARKSLLEIKFDAVRTNLGTLELDSAFISRLNGHWINRTVFVPDEKPAVNLGVNFVKGIITVVEPDPPPCNDMNGDGSFTSADVVEALNCVFLGIGDCGPISTPADVVKLLRSLFSSPMPLVPPTPCN